VKNNTTDVAAARLGAACLGVRHALVRHARSPWANLAAVGANHARTQNAVTAAGNPDARRLVSWPFPAQTEQIAPMSAELLPTVNGTRKQNVLKTRINAGGYGAMGPYPEREQPV
jgi:hypothetical protein